MFWPDVLIAALFGLLIGSFLNVCIFRMPYDISIARPRSFCPNCEKPIAWYDNLPLLSYALLRGRCRHCREPISWRYPFVEFLTACCFASAGLQYGFAGTGVKLALFSALVIGCIFTDLAERILPDEFTLGGTAAGLVAAYLVPISEPRFVDLFLPQEWTTPTRSLIEGVFGAAFPSLTIYLLGEIYLRLRKRDGLGLGDVKLIAMFGAFYGFGPTLVTLLAGSLMGSIVSVVFIRLAKKDAATYELPFGSFLGIAALLVQHLQFLNH